MPPPSEAVLRYTIINKCLTNPFKPFPTMAVLKYAIERELKTTVSTATIQKDIAQMKLPVEDGGYNAPIVFRRSRKGYEYDLVKFPEYTIQTFDLNDKEIEAIELAAGVLQQFKGIKVNDYYNQAIDKLLSAVDIKKTDKEKSLANAIQPEETPYMRGMEHFETIVSSIKKQTPISFIHYSYEHKEFKSIILHPYFLKESNKRWYLYGYSEEHKKLRYFGLDRIYDPILLDKKFIENNGSDLRNLFDNKIGLKNLRENINEQPEDIKLWVSETMSNYIKSMPIHKSQKHIEYDGYGEIEVTLHLVPTYELLSLILSYGKEMEILSPKWLRKKIELELVNSISKYK